MWKEISSQVLVETEDAMEQMAVYIVLSMARA
jgi:hypothetical protein